MQLIHLKKYNILIFGILIHVILALYMHANFYSWIEFDQTFFQLPLLVGLVVVVRGKINFFILSILSTIAYIFADHRIIDEKLYHYFVKYNFFPEIWGKGFQVNPQYTTILLYLFLIGILILQVIIKKYRTNDRFFVLLSSISIIVVTAIIHYAIVQKSLVEQLKYQEDEVSKYLDIVTLDEKTISVSTFFKLCENKSYQCFHENNFKLFNQLLFDLKVNNFLTLNSSNEGKKAAIKKIESSGFFESNTWSRVVIGQAKVVNPLGYYLIIEKKRVNDLQKHYENLFSQIAFAAHLIWGWCLLVLGLMHKSKWKNKIFV